MNKYDYSTPSNHKVQLTKHYAIDLIETVLVSEKSYNEPMKIPSSGVSHKIARSILPYCLAPLCDGCFILLNRNYKPLGVSNYQHWVDYYAPEYKSLTVPSKGVDLSILKQVGDGRYFFFNDGDSPIAGRLSSSIDKAAYLYRLWVAFKGLGINHPKLPYSTYASVSRRLNVSVDSLSNAFNSGGFND